MREDMLVLLKTLGRGGGGHEGAAAGGLYLCPSQVHNSPAGRERSGSRWPACAVLCCLPKLVLVGSCGKGGLPKLVLGWLLWQRRHCDGANMDELRRSICR